MLVGHHRHNFILGIDSYKPVHPVTRVAYYSAKPAVGIVMSRK